jgi:hypothetical protein
MHGIKLEQQEKINRKDQVKSANVYGDYNKAAQTRQTIRKIYKELKDERISTRTENAIHPKHRRCKVSSYSWNQS